MGGRAPLLAAGVEHKAEPKKAKLEDFLVARDFIGMMFVFSLYFSLVFALLHFDDYLRTLSFISIYLCTMKYGF